MNTVVEMFGRALPAGGDPGAAFAAVMPQVLAAPDDCGGIAALPFLDDEPGIGVSRGGTAALIGLDGTNATPGNVAKAMLLATIFNLRMGSDLLDAQGFPRTEIILSGGLTKTPGLGQILADGFHTPVVLLDGATEGTAWGAALMAKFRTEALAGKAAAWPAFLQRHATGTPTRFTPRPKSAAALDRAFARHQRLVAIHGQLDAAVHG
jgi:sugar (pentulose or hexulose) kinase